MNLIELCEHGYIHDALARFGMRRLIAQRLADEQRAPRTDAFINELKSSPIAVETAAANAQHYEVPAEFFRLHLGPRLKYSCCLYSDGTEPLAQAEEAMLRLYAERAGLADGMRILDLGCGWGSLTLWLAERYPRAQIVGLSNSSGQREFIQARAQQRGFDNVRILTGNVADPSIYAPDGVLLGTGLAGGFDRILSIEMFEHMRNYGALLSRISRWLKPGGRLFVHLFAHRQLAYPFQVKDGSDWMSRYFFSGGIMPSENLLLNFQDDLKVLSQWWIPGGHYQRTANHWLAGVDAQRAAILEVFRKSYSASDAEVWLQRWRMFYMAVAEMFGCDGGKQWGVAHYLFARRV